MAAFGDQLRAKYAILTRKNLEEDESAYKRISDEVNRVVTELQDRCRSAVNNLRTEAQFWVRDTEVRSVWLMHGENRVYDALKSWAAGAKLALVASWVDREDPDGGYNKFLQLTVSGWAQDSTPEG